MGHDDHKLNPLLFKSNIPKPFMPLRFLLRCEKRLIQTSEQSSNS